jgi:hypothetical protein
MFFVMPGIILVFLCRKSLSEHNTFLFVKGRGEPIRTKGQTLWYGKVKSLYDRQRLYGFFLVSDALTPVKGLSSFNVQQLSFYRNPYFRFRKKCVLIGREFSVSPKGKVFSRKSFEKIAVILVSSTH